MNIWIVIFLINKCQNINIVKSFGIYQKKNELKTNVFWDDFEMNAIEVYSETELTKKQYNELQELGVA